MPILNFKRPKKRAEELTEKYTMKVSPDGKTYQLVDKATGEVSRTDYMAGTQESPVLGGRRTSRLFEKSATKYSEPEKKDSGTKQSSEFDEKLKIFKDEYDKKFGDLQKENIGLKEKITLLEKKKWDVKDDIVPTKSSEVVGDTKADETIKKDRKIGLESYNTPNAKNVPIFSKSITIGNIKNAKEVGLKYLKVKDNIYLTDELFNYYNNNKLTEGEFDDNNIITELNNFNAFTPYGNKIRNYRTIDEARTKISQEDIPSNMKIPFTVSGKKTIFEYYEGGSVRPSKDPNIVINKGQSELIDILFEHKKGITFRHGSNNKQENTPKNNIKTNTSPTKPKTNNDNMSDWWREKSGIAPEEILISK